MAEEKEKEFEVPEGALAIAAAQTRIKTDRHMHIYANNLAIRFSSWDISLIFGEIMGEQEGKPVIEEVAHVTMSREFAKVMAVLLAKNIQAFERQFGEIKIPVITASDLESAEVAPIATEGIAPAS